MTPELDRDPRALMKGAAPQLLAVQGVGPNVAAQLLFTVGGSPSAYDPK